MNVSLTPFVHFLGNNSAAAVIQEVNNVVTNDSETISEMNKPSIIAVTHMRSNYLSVESLLLPALISGRNPGCNQ